MYLVTLIILFIAIIVIVLFYIIFRLVYHNKKDDTIQKTIFGHQLQTGDLLFVSYDNSLGKFMKVWSNSKWTHVGMVYKAPDNEIYVMETANYRKKKGVLLLPFIDWYKNNRHYKMVVKQLEAVNNNSKDCLVNLIHHFDEVNEKKLDTFGTSWLRLIGTKSYKSINERENITCYELVAHLLQEAEIIRKEKSPCSYLPSSMYYDELPKNENYSYTKGMNIKL
jgi:hypothetical protein